MTLADVIADVAELGLPRREAAAELAQRIGRNASVLKEYWRDYGPKSVASALAHHLPSARGPHHGHSRLSKRAAPSWRQQISDDPTVLLDLQLPVAGEVKAVRDLTPRDIDTIADGYRSLARVSESRAEQWKRVQRKLRSEETIGEAVEAGRLKLTDLMVAQHTGPEDAGLLEEQR